MHEYDELEPANAGGRTMRGFLPGIHRQTDPGGGGGDGVAGEGAGAAGGEAALAGGAGAGAAVDGGAAVVDEGASTAFSFDDPAVFEQLASNPRFAELVDERAAGLAGTIVDQRLSGLESFLQEQLGGGGGGGGGEQVVGDLDPFAPEFGTNLDARLNNFMGEIKQMLGQIAEPMFADQQEKRLGEGNQRLHDMLADDIARNGDFPRAPGATESKAQGLVVPLARVLFPSVQERFGATPRAAEIAMSRAAAMVREIVTEAQTAGANAEQNRLAVLTDARHEAGGGAVGVQGVGEIKARNIDEGLHAVSGRYRDLLRNGN